MPRRRLARLGSVSPASPMNTSSEPSRELPERQRGLQAGNDLGAQAELAALASAPAASPGRPDRRCLRLRTRRGGAARIVAVEALAVVDEVLGLAPTGRRSARASARRGSSSLLPLFAGIELVDLEVEAIAAQAGDAAQPRRPLGRVLAVDADARSRAPGSPASPRRVGARRWRTGRPDRAGRGGAAAPTVLTVSKPPSFSVPAAARRQAVRPCAAPPARTGRRRPGRRGRR